MALLAGGRRRLLNLGLELVDAAEREAKDGDALEIVAAGGLVAYTRMLLLENAKA